MSLYENIRKRRASGKPMRNKGDKGAPSNQDFVNAAKTAKKAKGGMINKGYKNGGKVKGYKGGGKVMGCNTGVQMSGFKEAGEY